jgi:hypothetical protein
MMRGPISPRLSIRHEARKDSTSPADRDRVVDEDRAWGMGQGRATAEAPTKATAPDPLKNA